MTKILELAVLPGGQDLSQVFLGVDNDANDTSYRYAVQSVLDAASGSTDITVVHSATVATIQSSTGTDGTLNLVTATLSGLMSPADKTKLDGLGSVDLGYLASPTDGQITNTDGTDSIVPLVDETNAGLMSPGDKAKLDGIDGNTNFANSDLTATEPRSHNHGLNSVTVTQRSGAAGGNWTHDLGIFTVDAVAAVQLSAGVSVDVMSPIVNIKGDATSDEPELRIFQAASVGSGYIAHGYPASTQSYKVNWPAGPGNDGDALVVGSGGGTGEINFEYAPATGLQNIVEDVTPQLGGELQTLDNDLVFTTGLGSEVARAGLAAGENALFIQRTDEGQYDPDDGGIVFLPGAVELRGSKVCIKALANDTGENRDVRVDADGNLYVAELNTTWTDTDTSAASVSTGTGTGQGSWVQVTGLTTSVVADVTAGDPLDIFSNLSIQNDTTSRDGSISVGFGIDGAAPTTAGIEMAIAGGFDSVLPVALRTTTHGGLTAGQTVEVWIRRESGAHTSFGVTADGSAMNHEMILSVPATGAGGGGGEANFLSSLGSGASIVGTKAGSQLNVRSHSSPDNSINVVQGTNEVEHTYTGAWGWFETVADMEATTGHTNGAIVNTRGFYSPGDRGGAKYVYKESGLAGQGGPNSYRRAGAGADDYFALTWESHLTTRQLGCRHDGVTDDGDLVREGITAVGAGGHLVISSGQSRVSGSFTPLEGQTIEWHGSWLFDDLGVAQSGGVVRLTNNRVHLITLNIDYQASSNTDNGVSGTQFVVDNTTGTDCVITKAVVYNAMDAGFSGAGKGLRIYGFSVQQSNEHGFYFSGAGTDNDTDIVAEGLSVSGVGLDNGHSEGHCIQIRRCKRVIFSNCILSVGSSVIPSMYFNIEDCHDIQVKGGVGKGSNSAAFTIGENVDTTKDILIDGFHAERVSGAGAISAVRRLDSSQNVRCTNSLFDGYSQTEASPETFEACTFLNVGTEFTPASDCRYVNCRFTSDGTTRYFRLNSSTAANIELINCTLEDDPTQLVWVESSYDATRRFICVGVNAPDFTSGNAFYFSGGFDHIVERFAAPLATDSRVIRVGSGVGGVVSVGKIDFPSASGTGVGVDSPARISYVDSEIYRASAPSNGWWSQGTVVFNRNCATGVDDVGWVCTAAGNPGTWVAWPSGGGGGGNTNLGIANRTATALDVTSDSGTDATVPEATVTDAGLLNATDKQKLSHVSITQAVNLDTVESQQNNLITLSGVAAGSTTLGTFTGSTIPDSSTNKAAFQSLETALEAITTTTITNGTGADISLVTDLGGDSFRVAGLIAGAGITLTPTGQSFTIAATGGGGTDRKDGQVTKTAASGAISIDFNSETDDNIFQPVNGTASIDIAQLTRGGEYHLVVASDDGTLRELTWSLSGTMTWAPTAQGNLPAWTDVTDGRDVVLYYDPSEDTVHVRPVASSELAGDATTLSGTWQPDYGYGQGRQQEWTGTIPSGVTLDIPLRMPIGGSMRLFFPDTQANGLTIAANSNIEKLTAEPTWGDGGATILIHRTTSKYIFTMSSAQ